MLIWHRNLWAIDHGAALLFQHSWPKTESWADRAYDFSKHVLAGKVATLNKAELAAIDEELAAKVTEEALAEILDLVPDEFLLSLNSAPAGADAEDLRTRYVTYLGARRDSARAWWPEPHSGSAAAA